MPPTTAQPAPSPVRAQTHTHHRLFLGPLPADAQGDSHARTRRQRYRRASEHHEAALVPDGSQGTRFSFRRHRQSTSLDAGAQHERADPFFIIGAEFQPKDSHDPGSTARPPVVLINPEILHRPSPSATPNPVPPQPISRPSIYPRKSTDRASFRTARSTAAGPSTFSKSVGTPGTARTGGTDFFSAKSSVSSLEEEVASDEAVPPASAFVRSPSPLDEPRGEPSPGKIRTTLRSALRRRDDDPGDDPSPTKNAKGSNKARRTVYFPLDDEPVEPGKVLARQGSAVVGTSAGVAEVAQRRLEREEAEREDGAEEEGKRVVVRVVEDGAEDDVPDMRGTFLPSKGRVVVVLMTCPDRMLVAVGKNTHPHLTGYDESQAVSAAFRCMSKVVLDWERGKLTHPRQRRKPSERVKAVEEYLVVYREGWVELYKEWVRPPCPPLLLTDPATLQSTPFGRAFRKSKRLCFAIPLLKGVTTFSVFSRRDMSFALCLDTVVMRDELQRQEAASPGRPVNGESASRRNMLDRMKRSKEFRWVQDQASREGGKNRSLVFVFIGRERTRMLDWCWRIWNDLGGVVPETLRIQVPIFDSIIDLPRPADEAGTLNAWSRSRILLDVFTALRSQLPDYDDLVMRERERSGGEAELRLELAWETEMHLDWVPPFAEWSVEDRKREWAVLAGLTMIQVCLGPPISGTLC